MGTILTTCSRICNMLRPKHLGVRRQIVLALFTTKTSETPYWEFINQRTAYRCKISIRPLIKLLNRILLCHLCDLYQLFDLILGSQHSNTNCLDHWSPSSIDQPVIAKPLPT